MMHVSTPTGFGVRHLSLESEHWGCANDLVEWLICTILRYLQGSGGVRAFGLVITQGHAHEHAQIPAWILQVNNQIQLNSIHET
jgi:hypothetical protein